MISAPYLLLLVVIGLYIVSRTGHSERCRAADGGTAEAVGSWSYFVLILINFLILPGLKEEEAVVLCVLQRCFHKRLTRALRVTPIRISFHAALPLDD